eukprot:TRINITY_DN4268_c0_g1_i1.p2 TRINITY_DN4268_c0_g1~~TRINITY_DN4268_c0_g1_i1.p2  ORF type:complete len:182 (-),score=35.32 TRINITY_DN4268_c0_g1_i1:938-1483(-)
MEAGLFYHRAVRKRSKGDLKGAIRDLGRAIDENTQEPEYYFARSLCYFGRRDYGKSKADVDRSLALNPAYQQALQLRILINLTEMNYDELIEDSSTLLAIDPSNADALASRGTAKLGKRLYLAALGDFDSALEFNTKHPAARSNGALCKFYLGDLKGAIINATIGIRLLYPTINPQKRKKK